MADSSIIYAMRDAARRTFEWNAAYGILGTWELTEQGLELRAKSDQLTVVRIVSWFSLEQATDPKRILELHEMEALHHLLNRTP
ncbi:hypothetical protein [Sulfitobacter sp. M23508]|uniref:hypothetical protein n=1 Tax=Sulfitobacter sp. M23508 TaxID=3368577 RepID=UPI0037469383